LRASLAILCFACRQIAAGVPAQSLYFPLRLQAVAEVVAADDVSEVERLSAFQERPSKPPPAGISPAAAPPAAVMASRGHSEPHLAAAAATPAGTQQAQQQQQQQAPGTPRARAEDAGDDIDSSSSGSVDPEELRRREVLSKLQGPDTQLESGLKVRCKERFRAGCLRAWLDGCCAW
jgi:hypothetical protein